MKNLSGKVAAITGAASGIGRSVAIELAKQGCYIAISDVKEDLLKKTQQEIQSLDAKVTATVVDVTQEQALLDWAKQIKQDFGTINIIVNNAGVALFANVRDMPSKDFKWLMEINFWGMVYGTNVFLPYLIESGEGHIVNISSLAAYSPMPGISAYSASKFAIRGFNEALRMELDAEPCGVSLTSIHPGFVRTEINRNARIINQDMQEQESKQTQFRTALENMPWSLSPESTAKAIIRSMKKNKHRALIGYDAHIVEILLRWFPVGFRRFLAFIWSRNNQK